MPPCSSVTSRVMVCSPSDRRLSKACWVLSTPSMLEVHWYSRGSPSGSSEPTAENGM
ncbi:MAG: hypothetical protein GWN18_10360 [Thermoplasmata archaeon]|nr:hypothetical protein [Thermoplasmata archaeon]NIS12447.1 hypothetical protein [Thermoplasmata archaeon]NIS20368.1 hypothetical protein [Thermoplasmata archaeon]NIU49455.1 hypothetical protein [Thermoplasmata archaeon]NIV79125.1 hypothetical protein [Thermoplasmata archaeon]